MTTLIFDWSDWDGPATGHVIVTRRTWRRAPESLHVPWQVVLPVNGRVTLDVAHVAGEVVSILWAPKGAASREDHVLVPDGGEHLAHLLERVDPSTLEPLPEDLPSAVDLVARAEALVSRIESGEFTGADGDDGRGITSVEMIGATARFTWTDGTTQDVDLSALAGDDGDNGVGVESVTLDGTTLRFSLSDGTTRDVDAAALRGKDGHAPDLTWNGTRLVVDGVPGPSLKGNDGHTPVPTWRGTALSWDGGEAVDLRGADGKTPIIKIGSVTSGSTPSATITGTPPDLTLGLVLPKGDPGTKGDPGAPGALANASSYVLVGPGRPDTPSTTGGVITGSEPVGAEYRSTDGASVGAWVWRRRPGGKWECVELDTLARYIAGDAVALPQGGEATIRRIGRRVRLTLVGIPRAYNSVIFNIPAGFRGHRGVNAAGQLRMNELGSLSSSVVYYGATANRQPGPPMLWGGSVVSYHGAAVADTTATVYMEWLAQDDPPVTLPGTQDLYSA